MTRQQLQPFNEIEKKWVELGQGLTFNCVNFPSQSLIVMIEIEYDHETVLITGLN